MAGGGKKKREGTERDREGGAGLLSLVSSRRGRARHARALSPLLLSRPACGCRSGRRRADSGARRAGAAARGADSTILGTGKSASLVGTSASAARYAKRVAMPWRSLLPAGLVAAGCSWVGARAVSLLNPALLKPVLLGLLLALWIYTMAKPTLGADHQPRFAPDRERWAVLAIAVGLGFYDRLLRPRHRLAAGVRAGGVARLRLPARLRLGEGHQRVHQPRRLLYFGTTQQVLWVAAVPMAAANLAGSLVGTRVALRGGSGVVRVFFLVIVAVLIGRLTGEVAGWW